MWKCFSCGTNKMSIDGSCPKCNPVQLMDDNDGLRYVQNNVNFYESTKYNEALTRRTKIMQDWEALNRPEAPGKEAQSFGLRLTGYTIAAMTWTGLAAIWFTMAFFGIVLYKAWFA